MGSRLAVLRRYSGWLAILALLPLTLLLAATAIAYAQGLRIQGLSWQNGLELAQWRRLQEGCGAVQGERLRIARWYPLTLTMSRLTIPLCRPATTEPVPPPWTPPFDLTVGSLTLPGLPPLAVLVHQRDQRWHAQALYRHSKATVLYDRRSGHWTAQGHIQAADLAPSLLGAFNVAGQGRWQVKQLDGALQAQGQQLGYRGQPQRGDAMLSARLAAKRWQLHAELAKPLALGGGWVLEARQGLHASGSLNGIQDLHLDLRATGPTGKARLALGTDGAGMARGSGSLTLAGPTLTGTVPLRWNQHQLELLPASLLLPQEARLSWSRPLMLPLTTSGSSALSAELQYQGLQIRTVNSQASWHGTEWGWQGRLDLVGQAAGLDLNGTWRGRADSAGLHGEPARLMLKGEDLLLALNIPVTGLRVPDGEVRATFDGHYDQLPLMGTLQARHTHGQWQGTVASRSRLPFYTQGGTLDVAASWYGKDGQWGLNPASRITLAKGLIGTTLIKPVTLAATTPLRLTPEGLQGELQVMADGIVAARGTLPPVTGQLTVTGQQGQASLRVPAWQSTLALTARRQAHDKKASLAGTVELATPLSSAISHGQSFTLQQGKLNGQGRWQWWEHGELQGDLNVSGLALDWGGILASGGSGTVHVELSPEGLRLASNGPVTLAELQVGTTLRNVRMTVQSDLNRWQLADVYADVLGGQLSAASLQWPSAQYQAVTVSHIDLAQVAALQNGPNPTVQLAGRVGGTLPLRLMPDALALQDGGLHNEGPLSLQVSPSAGVGAMAQSNRAVQLALDTLGHLAIDDFQAHLDMPPDGWLDAAVTIKGRNPQQNGQPVVLNYTHRENVLDLLRSLRIGDELSRRVVNRKPTGSSH